MKIMVTSFKRSHACTATFSAPNPVAGQLQPMPLPETPGHSQANLGQSLVGSLFLYPESWFTQGSICACQEFVSQSCVSSGGSVVRNLPIRKAGSIPGLGRSSGEGNVNTLQYSCLENPTERRAW